MASFDDAYTAVLLSQPFFGQLLTRYKVEETNSIPTLAVSTKSLLWNRQFFDTLDDDTAIAAITHEVLHGVFQHLVEIDMYQRTGIGPDGLPFDQDKYNRAADYVINDLIKVNKIGTLGENWCWDAAYPHTMTPQEVYSALPSTPPKSGGKGGGKGKQSHDTHISDGAAAASEAGDQAVGPADVMAAYEAAKAMGCAPAGMDRVIAAARRPRHSPWAMLRQAYISASRGSDTTTWRRLHRRMITRNVVMPSRSGFAAGRVGVVIDTSGSINDALLQLFGSHLGAIMTDARPREARLYWTEAVVQRVDVARSGQEVRKIIAGGAPGGGGTDMEAGIKAALADACDVIVVLTDGYTSFNLSKPSAPVIWAMTTDVVAPYGKTIKIC